MTALRRTVPLLFFPHIGPCKCSHFWQRSGHSPSKASGAWGTIMPGRKGNILMERLKSAQGQFTVAGVVGLMLLLGVSSLASAQAIDSSEYFPVTAGDRWVHLLNDKYPVLSTILEDKVNIGGMNTSVQYFPQSGSEEYYTSDLNGIRLHRLFQPNFPVADLGNVDISFTFVPPMVYANGLINIGETFYSSGKIRMTGLPWGGVDIPYHASFTFTSFETVTVPAGDFNVIVISGTLTIAGETGPVTLYLGKELGVIKKVEDIAILGLQGSWKLISTNAGHVTLLAPSGGEILPSGGTYDIRWEASADAESFAVKYSMDNGVTWVPIPGSAHVTNTDFLWTVPVTAGNRRSCRIMVTGYNAADKKIGSDLSDAPFTIEVVRATSPKRDVVWNSGETRAITWITNETSKEVSTVKLFYTRDGGITWIPIPAAIAGNPERYDWVIPPVPGQKAKKKCKVKVVLKDAKGLTLGSDASNGYFTLQPLP